MQSTVKVFCISTSPTYFSLVRILRILPVVHSVLPSFVLQHCRSNVLAISFMLTPSRNISKIFRMISASSGTIMGILSSPRLYPSRCLKLYLTLPSLKPICTPKDTFLLIDSDSACANEPYRAIMNSDVMVSVLMFSFSKITPIPRSFSCRTYSRQSTVFRANRLMDFVRMPDYMLQEYLFQNYLFL